MATHDLDFAAAAGARLMLIADGRMAAPGTAGTGPVIATATAAGPPRVAAIRSFIRRRRRRPWYDWYSTGFAVVLAVILLWDLLAQPFGRLSGPGGTGGAAPAQAVAGAALVIGAAAGLLVLAQAFGPLALSPADAAWLLLTPLDRRDVLRRPAAATAGIAVARGRGARRAGAGHGRAVPTAAERAGTHRVPWAWLLLCAVAGAGFFAAAMLDGGAGPALAAMAGPAAGGRRGCRRGGHRGRGGRGTLDCRLAGDHRQVRGAGYRDVRPDCGRGGGRRVHRRAAGAADAAALPGRAWSGPARRGPGPMLLAAAFLNVPLLTWIAEDSHWRGRRLDSRPWPRLAAFSPRLAPAFVLAWADWRRLGRRPAVLAALAVSALAPALAGAAFTGHAHGWVTAAVLLAGAMAAGTQGTAATRRDTNDPALRRLLGVDAEAALVARAVLPALLGAAWLALALALLALTGELPGCAVAGARAGRRARGGGGRAADRPHRADQPGGPGSRCAGGRRRPGC